MCTVTFLPCRDRVYFTSNRDELRLREMALVPKVVEMGSGRILFPEDGRAHGTWIAAHENGNIMVLLNGAFMRHTLHPPYRQSRGLIFLEIFDDARPVDKINDVNLEGIEPFTLVIWQLAELWEFRWDGETRFMRQLPTDVPILWASATLYDEQVITNRRKWFSAWLHHRQLDSIGISDIAAFHEFAGNGDAWNDLKMNRDGLLLTVSITAIEWTINKTVMQYKDLVTNTTSVNIIP